MACLGVRRNHRYTDLMVKSTRALGVVIASLCVLFAAVWYPQLRDIPFISQLAAGAGSSGLTVAFLDVGQGDAIFIRSPTGKQVLIDGGPNREVLRELGEVMPWNDKSIDVVIATHPDADHISGLVDVLQRYDVDLIVEPGVKHDTPQTESMLASVASEGAQEMIARRGQSIDLGDGVRLDILFPDRDVSNVETNTASIVARLVYGETAFMLTGDSPDEIEQYLVRLGSDLRSDVLKAGHHGSKTSSSQKFIDAVSPQYVVYSRGCDNTYGHPNPDVVARFTRAGAQAFDTCEDGRVVFISDGSSVRKQ